MKPLVALEQIGRGSALGMTGRQFKRLLAVTFTIFLGLLPGVPTAYAGFLNFNSTPIQREAFLVSQVGTATDRAFLPMVAKSDSANPPPMPTPTPSPTVTSPPTCNPPTPNCAGWTMVAANPQRTSWTPEQVSGNLHVEAYRAIEPYIPQHVQIIAANNLLYLSTARGLYALYASDPDGNGALRPLDLAWRFDTELPLGNSPTYDNGVVYVGGFDRKLYALNATTGALIWSFDGAKAGYDTNPVVADGKVMLGNRDGNFYAVNASNGTLAWSYATNGPINFSAAYKNGVVYFASMDNRAYALNASNGSLVWKSNVMGGDGFYSYWPVVYTNPEDGQDYVIFVAASGYRAFSRPGVDSLPTDPNCSPSNYIYCYSEWVDEFNGNVTGNLGPIVSVNQPWVQGNTVVDYSNLLQYFEENPNNTNPAPHWHKAYRRFYYIYNTQPGANQTAREWNMDSDGDGFREYAPIDPYLSNSGNPYPPVVVGNQNSSTRLLYMGNHYESNGTSRIMGWRFGTKYFTILPFMPGAGDEPNALSAGGNLIYRSICCDRVGDWADTTGGGNNGELYNYDLLSQAPNYNQMWWYPTGWSDMDGLYGNYGNVGLGTNGVYNSHGDQNPLVPYNGKLYIHRGNAVIMFGTGTQRGQITPYVASISVKQTLTAPSLDELKSRLETEVRKIVDAGHLRPGYYNAGQFNGMYPELNDYFAHPGDTIYTLSIAYPYITNTAANNNLKDRLRTYLKDEFANFSRISWSGAKREWSNLPPEVETDMASGAPVNVSQDSYYNYALWKYVQNVAPEDRQLALGKTTTNGSNMDDPYATNRAIAGTVGLRGLNGQSTVVTSCTQFSKDSPWLSTSGYQKRTLNIARNFMFMVPELADCLRNNPAVTQAIAEYEKVGPYWFVSRYTASIGESTNQNLYDYPALFQAKAWIQQLSRQELTKWLDVPAFEKGDLFYIQNLVAVLSAQP